MEMLGAGDTSGPALSSRHRAGVLTLVARVEDEGGAAPARVQHLFCLGAQFGAGSRGENSGLRGGNRRGGRTPLGGAPSSATAEDADVIVAVVGERPPKAGGELATRVVVDDDVGAVTDAQRVHQGGETVRRGDLCGHGVIGVGNVVGPVDVDGAGDVGLVVLVARGQILCLLATVAKIPLLYVAADVNYPQVRVVEVLGEPLRLGKGVEVSHRCYLFLLKEVVFASESFGEFPGPFGLVLAEPAFDDLVLQVVFYTLDPTPRSTPKEPHEIVAV